MNARTVSRARPTFDLAWLLAAGVGAAIIVSLASYEFGVLGSLVAAVVPAVLGWLLYVSRYARAALVRLRPDLTSLSFLLMLLLAGMCVEAMLPDISERTAQQLNESPFNLVNLIRAATVAVTGLLGGSLAIRYASRIGDALRGPMAGIALYAAAAVVSAGYASSPVVSAGKAFELAADALLGLLLAGLLSTQRIVAVWNVLWLYLGGMVVALWVGTALNPSEAFDTAGGTAMILHGWRPQIAPNTLGQYGVCLCVVACARLLARAAQRSIERTIFWGGVFGLGLVTIAGAQARTTAAALPLVLGVCFYLHRRWRLLATSLAAGGLLGLSAAGTFALDFLRRNQSLEQLTTLSGRLNYWAAAWQFFTESKWLGHGYYTSTRLDLNARFIYTGLDLSTVEDRKSVV